MSGPRPGPVRSRLVGSPDGDPTDPTNHDPLAGHGDLSGADGARGRAGQADPGGVGVVDGSVPGEHDVTTALGPFGAEPGGHTTVMPTAPPHRQLGHADEEVEWAWMSSPAVEPSPPVPAVPATRATSEHPAIRVDGPDATWPPVEEAFLPEHTWTPGHVPRPGPTGAGGAPAAVRASADRPDPGQRRPGPAPATAGDSGPPPSGLQRVLTVVEEWPALVGLGFAALLVAVIVLLFASRADLSSGETATGDGESLFQRTGVAPTPEAPVAAAPTTVASTTTTAAPTTSTSTTSTTSTTVAPVDQAPVAVDDSITARRRAYIDVLANDTAGSSDLNPLTLRIVTEPEHAREVFVGLGWVIYRPERRYSGPDYLEYEVCDFVGSCSTAGVAITVED